MQSVQLIKRRATSFAKEYRHQFRYAEPSIPQLNNYHKCHFRASRACQTGQKCTVGRLKALALSSSDFGRNALCRHRIIKHPVLFRRHSRPGSLSSGSGEPTSGINSNQAYYIPHTSIFKCRTIYGRNKAFLYRFIGSINKQRDLPKT